jgi:GTPase SAR1 family protein
VEEITKYRIVLLGDAGVGKTALVSQFMTSEYMNTYDASLGKEWLYITRLIRYARGLRSCESPRLTKTSKTRNV